ncbi:MAG TPA: hypothetical protein VFI55_09330 [Mycobacterium sp.]|nr:hypothetical protein [Mycobacterium sp.]
MTTTPHRPSRQTHAAGTRRRQLRVMQLIFAGAAAIAMFALFDAARPDTTETMLGSGSVRLADMAGDLPAPASGPQFPQTPPNLSGGNGFAADDSNDQAQLQEQQSLQQMQQEMQQAQEQNDAAEQQFLDGMQQAQMDEQQANNP